MTTKSQRQFGLWDSPVSPSSLSRGITFSDIACDQDGTLVWLEGRSDRGVLVVQPADGQASRDLNSESSVRARVGYGGGDFTVGQGYIYFVDEDTGRLYRQPTSSGSAVPITPEFGAAAAPTLSSDGRWLVFVHSYEDKDHLAIIDAEGKQWPQKLVEGDDFYMHPCWHPDRKSLAWISWDHPNMPWDGTYLRSAELVFGEGLPSLKNITTLAGGSEISIFQPQFSPDGRFLAYVSDESGWWQIYLVDLESGNRRQLTDVQAEHGMPAWVQGMRTYTFSQDGRKIYFLRNLEGFVSLWRVNLEAGQEERLALDETVYSALEQICATPNGVGLLASSGKTPARVVTFSPLEGSTAGTIRIWRRATAEAISASSYANPEAVTWPAEDGTAVHGLFYQPTNPAFEGIGKPPLIVRIHGGPTSQVRSNFSPPVQFFTSRGYAVLELNYRGSTGYGRGYRNLLRKNWGICDVQDAVSGSRFLVERGLVDGTRLVIMGGSAGGFTVLKTLEDFPGFFKAGICLFGVSNQFTLAAETHKFEARYADTLLGSLPEAAEIYYQRSPIFFLNRIIDPLAIFQGDVDAVVPRKQSDEVAAALQRSGVPCVYHVYPGEGHGFRKAETIEHFYHAVENFLRQYVIFS